jgi:hypothetical protein
MFFQFVFVLCRRVTLLDVIFIIESRFLFSLFKQKMQSFGATLESYENATLDFFLNELTRNPNYRDKMQNAMDSALQSKKDTYQKMRTDISETIVKEQYEILRTLCQYGERKAIIYYTQYEYPDRKNGVLSFFKTSKTPIDIKRWNSSRELNTNDEEFKQKEALYQMIGVDPRWEWKSNGTVKSRFQEYQDSDVTVLSFNDQCDDFTHDWLSALEEQDKPKVAKSTMKVTKAAGKQQRALQNFEDKTRAAEGDVKNIGGRAGEEEARKRNSELQEIDRGIWRGDRVYTKLKETNQVFFRAMAANDRITSVFNQISLKESVPVEKRFVDFVRSIQKLRELFGRKDVQDQMAKLCMAFMNNPVLFKSQYLTFSITGGAGTGKTETAKLIGRVLASLGLLVEGNFETYSRATLVGQYIGETADKVLGALTRNYENVVFIDEAYAVAQGSGDKKFDPYGIEALNELTGFLDKHKGQIALIVAGYKCEMEEYFFGANVGLRRRFRTHWRFEPYQPKELLCILDSKLKGSFKLQLDKIADDQANQYLRGFFFAKVDGDDNQDFSNFSPGQFIYRRLFVDEGGAMENLATSLATFFRGSLNGQSQITGDDMIRILTEEVFARDKNEAISGKSSAQVRVLDDYDSETNTCVREFFPQVFQHSSSDDVSKELIFFEKAIECVKTRIQSQAESGVISKEDLDSALCPDKERPEDDDDISFDAAAGNEAEETEELRKAYLLQAIRSSQKSGMKKEDIIAQSTQRQIETSQAFQTQKILRSLIDSGKIIKDGKTFYSSEFGPVPQESSRGRTSQRTTRRSARPQEVEEASEVSEGPRRSTRNRNGGGISLSNF